MELTFVETQKIVKKKKSIIWIVKKQWKHLFIVIKKVVFENTENTKNKNTLHSSNKFFMSFVFENKKQEPNKPLICKKFKF